MEQRGRPKGGTNVMRTAQEKMKYVSMIVDDHMSMMDVSRNTGINTGTLFRWVKQFREGGISALENRKKTGNPLAKYHNKKSLSREEELEYEVLKLRIENLRLKKGYTSEEADRAKRKL